GEQNPFAKYVEEIHAEERREREAKLAEAERTAGAERQKYADDSLGTDPESLLGKEGADWCTKFLEYMAAKGYPGSQRFGPKDYPAGAVNLLRQIFFPPQPRYTGYAIGLTLSIHGYQYPGPSYPPEAAKAVIMLSANNRLRTGDGGAVNTEECKVVIVKPGVVVMTSETPTGFISTGPHIFYVEKPLEIVLAEYSMGRMS
ncbi:MAG TPA: hypothetical protein VEH48_01680, partial [Candidatus Nitrosopolaris sp.]|nr:hypothetical protein [Candidatus Nitrosopolaris sp.]